MTESLGKMVARSGKTEADILQMMKKETYINASEALEYGLCDKIEDSADHNKKRLSNFTTTEAYWSEANKIVNKLISKPGEMSLKLVTNKLGLTENASEDSILEAITKMENKAKSDSETYDAKIKDLQKQKDDLDEEMDKLKKEKAEMKDAKDKAEDEMLTEKCKNMVSDFAKIGKIKDDVKTLDFWTALAKADFDLAKEQIEAIPVNKKAPVINIVNGDKPKYSMGIAMAEIKAKYDIKNNSN